MKITFDEMMYITRKKKRNLFEKYCATWKLIKRNDNEYVISGYVRWWYYIIAFLPACFLAFMAGGLSYFEKPKREFFCHNCIGWITDPADSMYNRMREIYGKKT